MNDRKLGSSIFSFLSQMSVRERTDTSTHDEINKDVAVYKGIPVRLKRLHIKDILQNNKELLQEFKMIRDINHANLARLCGACLDARSRVLVGEYCPKGTLQDLLGNPQIKLDAQFKFSLAIDIVQGMCFLHDSHLRRHGRLKSSCCLIDNRFTVKLADFGLQTLYSNITVDKSSQEYLNGASSE
ncbi:receptor-type guanylate cyclase gcy-28-like [Haliotis rubra]|uniref:receptor-type guanylate cyclase gcy-28-like n=1 Tax=Haliotis rubra TaxID=36100 RepID=UPI001EE5E2E3|nr:receptor-type guanylate cyclase gcy-28-like [Haliotis rubra]